MRKLYIVGLLFSNVLLGQRMEIDLSYQIGQADQYVYSHNGSEEFLTIFGGYEPYILHTIGIQVSGYADGHKEKWMLHSFAIDFSSMDVTFEDPYGSRYIDPRYGMVTARDEKVISSNSQLVSATWMPSYYHRIFRNVSSQFDCVGSAILGMRARYSHEYTYLSFAPDSGATSVRDSYYGDTFELKVGLQVGCRYSVALGNNSRLLTALEFPLVISQTYWTEVENENKSNISFGYFRLRCGIAF